MVYALAISIGVALLLIALSGVAVSVARQASAGGGLRIGSWRWFPSPFAVLLLIPLLGLILWRFFPALLFIPFVLPFFWRRGLARTFFMRRRGPRSSGDTERDSDAEYRPRDER